MSAIETIETISKSKLVEADLRYCLVNDKKLPFTVNDTMAKPNSIDDFVKLEDLIQNKNLGSYSGVGISIQASKICAVDVDHCFSKKNDISSITEIGQQVLDIFKDIAYCEFSFSGTGLRILFIAPIISNYVEKYYIKNANHGIEYYQPSNSYRYVTVTGNFISNNDVSKISLPVLFVFLDKFMKRQEKKAMNVVHTLPELDDDGCMNRIRYFLFKNGLFQDLWFKPAPGSGSDESERDYHLVAFLYENVTQDHDQLKRMFEQSDFFKTKDSKHVYKWEQQDGRYFNYLYDNVQRSHC